MISEYERMQLKLKCVEVFIVPASKYSIEKGDVFTLGDKLWQYISQVETSAKTELPQKESAQVELKQKVKRKKRSS